MLRCGENKPIRYRIIMLKEMLLCKKGFSFHEIAGFPSDSIPSTGLTPRNEDGILNITTWILMPGNKEVHYPSFLCVRKIMTFCNLAGRCYDVESAGCIQLLK